MPDDLTYLSISGGSGLSLLKHRECPMKTRHMLDGWVQRYKAHYFAYGSVLHAVAFKPYLEPEHDKDSFDLPAIGYEAMATVCETQKYISTVAGMELEEEVRLTDDQRRDFPGLAKNQLTLWQERMYPQSAVSQVEQTLVSPLIDANGNEAPGLGMFRLAGRPDLVLNERAITDLKTPKTALTPTSIMAYNYPLSLGTYRYLKAVLDHVDIRDIRIWQLTKHTTVETMSKHSGEVLVRTPTLQAVYEWVRDTAGSLLQCMESGVWPKNPAACGGPYSICEMYPLCWPDQMENAQDAIEATLKRVRWG